MTELEAIELWRLIDEYKDTATDIIDPYNGGRVSTLVNNHSKAEKELDKFIRKLVQG